MKTWVLVFFMNNAYVGGPAAIPGYLSEDACRNAGKALAAQSSLVRDKYYCIPGP